MGGGGGGKGGLSMSAPGAMAGRCEGGLSFASPTHLPHDAAHNGVLIQVPAGKGSGGGFPVMQPAPLVFAQAG